MPSLEVIPRDLRDVILRGLSPGPKLRPTPTEDVCEHRDQMTEPPELAPFDAEEQRLFLEFLLDD